MRSDIWKPDFGVGQAIIAKYKSGQSARQLGFEHGIADVTITKFLKRHKVNIRNRSDAKRKWTLNENAFDQLDEAAFYWIGFLLADGNIYENKTRSLQLNVGLAEKDVGHLEKLKKFLGCNKPLYSNNDAAFFSVYSNKLCNKLAEFNIVPRKSLIAQIPDICKNNRDFWRGMIDGDGWVSMTRTGYPIIGLCGALNIIHDFLNFINKKYSIRQKGSSYMVNVSCAAAISLSKILYDQCCVCLTRKRIKVDSFKKDF